MDMTELDIGSCSSDLLDPGTGTGRVDEDGS